jgi:hypothetical protein
MITVIIATTVYFCVIGKCTVTTCNAINASASNGCGDTCYRLGNSCYETCPDNYNGDSSGYCVSLACSDRIPVGDYKSCSLANDSVLGVCYYKRPQVDCITTPCPQVFFGYYFRRN